MSRAQAISTRTRDAFVGLVYLVLLVALIALSIMIYNKDFISTTNVALHTDSVGSSLQNGSDVKVRGVLVGEVKSISTDGAGAVLHLALNPGKARTLPANMTAQLLPKTLFGERYVSLQYPDQPSSRTMHSGDQLQQDTSAQSVELEHLFADLMPVLQAVQPEKLSATLTEMATALRGRGDDLAAMMTTIGSYLHGLAPSVPTMTADLKALASVAKTYNEAAPNLIEALNSMTTTSQTIFAQRQQLTDLLAAATSMSKTVGGFISENQQSIIGLSADSLPSLQILAKYASEFPCLSRTLVNYIPVANKAFGVGTKQPGGHVNLHIVPTRTPYTTTASPPLDDTLHQCPYAPTTALANTALADVPGVTGANNAAATGGTEAVSSAAVSPAAVSPAAVSPAAVSPAAVSPAAMSAVTADPAGAGLGTVNSPQENQMIAELVAPTDGTAPSAYPRWASLMLGPALRGMQVSVK